MKMLEAIVDWLVMVVCALFLAGITVLGAYWVFARPCHYRRSW